MSGHKSRQFANKRKPSLETTAETSSVKRSEPNRYAQYAKILEKQYRCLSNTTLDLEEELQELKQALEQGHDEIEKERWETLAELEKIKQNMSHLSSDVHLKTPATQDSNFRSIAQCDNAIDRLLYNNEQVSKCTQDCLISLGERGSEESEKRRSTELDEIKERIIKSYQTQLASEIELEAQKGAIKALEKELQKVNGLPQILPILRSSIKDCEQAVKQYRGTVSNLEETRLPFIITAYIKQQLRTSTSGKKIENTVHNESKHDAYDEVIDILLEQAAIQQLFLYIMELEEDQMKLVTDHQEALLLDNKVPVEVADTLQSQCKPVRHYMKEGAQTLLDSLGKILNLKYSDDMDILENLEGGDCNTPKTVADRLEKLQLDDRAARNRTEASVTSLKKLVVDSYTAVERTERYASLYYKSQDSHGLIPTGIIQTQEQLETLVEDLQSEIQHYQKIITVNSELAEKKRRFALFWTDQQLFEQEFGRMKSIRP